MAQVVQMTWSVSGGYYPESIIKYVAGIVTPLDSDWVLCQTNSTEWRLAIGNSVDALHYSDVSIYTLTSDVSGYKVSDPVSADILSISNYSNFIFYGSLVSDFTVERSDPYAGATLFGLCACFLTCIILRIFRHVS